MHERKRMIWYFSLLQFLFYSAGSLWSYCNIYFRELGFSAKEVGLISSVGIGVAMAALPVVGVISDRYLSPKTIVKWAIRVFLPAYVLIPLAGHFLGANLPVMILLGAGVVVSFQIAVPMVDSWNGEETDRLGISYATVRRFGSVSYIVMMFLASALVGTVFPKWSSCVIAVIMGLPLLFMVRGKQTVKAADDKPREKASNTGELLSLVFRNYYFVTYLLLIMAFNVYVYTVDLSISYLMDFIGVAASMQGVVIGFRSIVEFGVMFFIGSRKKLPPYWILLACGGMLVAAEYLMYPVVRGMGPMLLVTLGTGAANGIIYGVGANYVFQIVGYKASSTAMSVLGVTRCLLGVIGGIIGGVIIDAYGVIALTNGVGFLALGLTVLFILSCLLGRKILKIPYVTEKETAAQ